MFLNVKGRRRVKIVIIDRRSIVYTSGGTDEQGTRNHEVTGVLSSSFTSSFRVPCSSVHYSKAVFLKNENSQR